MKFQLKKEIDGEISLPGIQTHDVGVRHPLLFGLPYSSSHSPYYSNKQNRPNKRRSIMQTVFSIKL